MVLFFVCFIPVLLWADFVPLTFIEFNSAVLMKNKVRCIQVDYSNHGSKPYNAGYIYFDEWGRRTKVVILNPDSSVYQTDHYFYNAKGLCILDSTIENTKSYRTTKFEYDSLDRIIKMHHVDGWYQWKQTFFYKERLKYTWYESEGWNRCIQISDLDSLGREIRSYDEYEGKKTRPIVVYTYADHGSPLTYVWDNEEGIVENVEYVYNEKNLPVSYIEESVLKGRENMFLKLNYSCSIP